MKLFYLLKLIIVFCCLFSTVNAGAEVYFRYNQAGYSPERVKKIIIMSDDDIVGQQWRLENDNGEVQAQGALSSSIAPKTKHTAKPFNYVIDISNIVAQGNYELTLIEKTVKISVSDRPYQHLLNPMIRFLRGNRSGTADTLYTPASHLGDSELSIYRPKGDLSEGLWQVDTNAQKADMLGGWYDAADYIKFTLTTAYTTYYLLRAYQEAPELFTKEYSRTALIDVLDEAKVGLDYLLKTYPSNDEFIIQVSSGDDHQQGFRLPQDDKRDGQREAFSAISPSHMGLTSAALALGAVIFNQHLPEAASAYQDKAINIYQRARQDDALPSPAFERNSTNDFYRDNSSDDNMGLAAIELYRLMNEAHYLNHAKRYAELAGQSAWASWCCVTSSLHYRLSTDYLPAQQSLGSELSSFQNYAQSSGNIWGIPMRPTWAPLLGAHVVASYAGLHTLNNPAYVPDLLWDNLDYFLGRNNWGVSFIASPSLINPATHVYSQLYQLTKKYPLGAVSEGPGSRRTYEKMKAYFTASPLDKSFEPFKTDEQVFYDNETNFQTMESTIALQATTIYMVAIASKVKSSTAIQPVEIAIPLPNTNEKQASSKHSAGGSMSFWAMIFLLLIAIKNNNNFSTRQVREL